MPSPSPPQPSSAGSGQPGGTAGQEEEGRAVLDPEQRVRNTTCLPLGALGLPHLGASCSFSMKLLCVSLPLFLLPQGMKKWETRVHDRDSEEELLPRVVTSELTTVKDEEMDFTCVEEEQMNSARRYMGMDMKVENCGNLVFWVSESKVYLLLVVRGLLIAVASLAVEHEL
ncbi:hypothetical protein MJG53_018351 [Ovis ammon polii x Ovis aries]|uniref:Uncharacterized protein n=1 Tax=Ovis ammon polii x Ovis aries TaxID=2918886 RepID=A0ACB9U6N9_9CETA|nr:hypothetical protein MJG53_018351 [Ovis ammon polii x Ovis aries]